MLFISVVELGLGDFHQTRLFAQRVQFFHHDLKRPPIPSTLSLIPIVSKGEMVGSSSGRSVVRGKRIGGEVICYDMYGLLGRSE